MAGRQLHWVALGSCLHWLIPRSASLYTGQHRQYLLTWAHLSDFRSCVFTTTFYKRP